MTNREKRIKKQARKAVADLMAEHSMNVAFPFRLGDFEKHMQANKGFTFQTLYGTRYFSGSMGLEL